MLGPLATVIETTRREMDARGWQPESREAGARARDVELVSTARDVGVRVLCLGPSSSVEGPGFIRIEGGAADAEPSLWAVVKGVRFGGGAADPVREMPAFQVAGGADRVVVGVGLWVSHAELPYLDGVVKRAFEVFDLLRADLAGRGVSSLDAMAPGLDPFCPTAGVVSPRHGSTPLVVGWSAIVLSVAGTIASFVASPEFGFGVLATVLPTGVLGGIATIRQHRHDAAPGGTKALARSLKACSLFDVRQPIGVLQPINPVVIMERGPARSPTRVLGTTTFRAAFFEARSTKHGIGFRASLQSLTAEQKVLADCLVVPETWAVVEITGPADVLDRLPVRPGQREDAGRVRQMLAKRDLEASAIDETLASLTHAVELGQPGPYR